MALHCLIYRRSVPFWRQFHPLARRQFLTSAGFQSAQVVHSRKTEAIPRQTTDYGDESNGVNEEEDGLGDVMDLLRSRTIEWNSPGPAQFDFRSDVVTTPTLPMLRAILKATLLDDVYREDPTTISLEARMAALTGKSDAIFVLSGTMSNMVALRTQLTQPPHAILCDARAHIIHWEAGGLASLCGAMVQGVTPSNGEYITLEDVQRKAILSDDVHKCPTRVIALENTISGLIYPLSEAQRISKWARRHGMKMHLDGARLWEAVAAGGGSLREYAECFDSIALDFSKGLGAPMGAIIVGDKKFIAQARRIRKSLGGGMRQAGVLSAAARVAVDEVFFEKGVAEGRVLREVHSVAREVADAWLRKGGKLLRRTETNLAWVDLRAAGMSEESFQELGKRYGIKVDGSRIVLHRQIGEEGLRRLNLVFDAILRKPRSL